MHPLLATVVCILSFGSLVLTSKPDVISQEPLIVTNPAEPQEGVIRRYPVLSSCVEDIAQTSWQSSASYSIDTCHDLNPRLTESFVISVPPSCSDGTRATLATFTDTGCSENSTSVAITDEFLGTCVDISAKWSFAFECYGVEPVGETDWARLGMMAGILAATLLFGGLGVAVSWYGAQVVAFSAVGWLSWWFRTVGSMCLGTFKLPDEVLPEEEGDEMPSKVESK